MGKVLTIYTGLQGVSLLTHILPRNDIFMLATNRGLWRSSVIAFNFMFSLLKFSVEYRLGYLKYDSPVSDSTYCMAFHKLLGNVSTTSCISSNSAIRVNFIFFEKLGQLLELKMALLPYFSGLLDQCFFAFKIAKRFTLDRLECLR